MEFLRRTPALSARMRRLDHRATSVTRVSRVCVQMAFVPHGGRYLATHTPSTYGAVVAGAGPAGLAVVGTLLDQKMSGKILWIDPNFKAGMLGDEWREVPSNTKVDLFLAFAQAVKPFREVAESASKPNAVTTLEDLPRDRGCSISYAADMVDMLTSGLRQHPQVDFQEGSVTQANWEKDTSSWIVESRGGNRKDVKLNTLSSQRLVLCTGSHPNEVQLPIAGLRLHNLDLYAALKPSSLQQIIPRDATNTVAVIGSSHSAILCLLNLYNLARSSHPRLRVKWFTRSSLQYAVPKDGWILRDNTGLKGIAADFARDNLEDSKLVDSEAGRFIEKHDLSGGDEKKVYKSELAGCQYIVRATGFNKNALPKLAKDGRPIIDPVFESSDGGFLDAAGEQLPRVYGAGIAFPERVTDPEGNVEHAVGMWKFMKYLKRVGSQWAA